jgi:predicted O-methyltransferase YrrM
MDNTIFSAVDTYIANLLNPADDALTKTEASIETENIPPISVSPNQGKFLHILAKLCNAKKILEIGTLGGYSTKRWQAYHIRAGTASCGYSTKKHKQCRTGCYC